MCRVQYIMGSTLFQVAVLWTGQGTLKGVLDGVRCHSYIQRLPEIIPSGAGPTTPVPYVPSTPNRLSSAPVSE